MERFIVTESWEMDNSMNAVEEAIRDAGGFVQASDDLRPRVLESARLNRREQRARRMIGKLACMCVVLALALSSIGERLQVMAEGSRPIDSAGVFSMIEAKSLRSNTDVGWGFVEVFTDLRRQQANSFRLST